MAYGVGLVFDPRMLFYGLTSTHSLLRVHVDAARIYCRWCHTSGDRPLVRLEALLPGKELRR